jgi:hypothetical protein
MSRNQLAEFFRGFDWLMRSQEQEEELTSTEFGPAHLS